MLEEEFKDFEFINLPNSSKIQFDKISDKRSSHNEITLANL